MKITVVIPVFNERETLTPLAEQAGYQLRAFDHRILFIDDGSTDGSWDVLLALHAARDDVDAVRFGRNAGKTAALAAGFARADGDIVITMDADLQDDPKEIPRFIAKIEDGYDVVTGWKVMRHDPWTKRFPSRVYNRVIASMFSLDIHDVNCGYKALRTDVAKRLPLHGGMHRLIPVLAARTGARVTEIAVQHHPRRWGASKYGIERFWQGMRDAFLVFFSKAHPAAEGLPDAPGLVVEELRHP